MPDNMIPRLLIQRVQRQIHRQCRWTLTCALHLVKGLLIR